MVMKPGWGKLLGAPAAETEKQALPALSAPPAPPPDRIAEIQHALRANFERASKGSYCRTLTFYMLPAAEGEEGHEQLKTAEKTWREAVLCPDGKWLVQDARTIALPGVEFMGLDAGESSCVRHIPVKGFESVTYVEAIEKLAEYQIANRDMNLLPAGDPRRQIESLGRTYFITMAEEEGLVVTMHGSVCPVYQGQVITIDPIPLAVRERVRAAYEARQNLPFMAAILAAPDSSKNTQAGKAASVYPADAAYMHSILRALENIENNFIWAGENEEGFHARDNGKKYKEWCGEYADSIEAITRDHLQDNLCGLQRDGEPVAAFYEDLKKAVSFYIALAVYRKEYLDLKSGSETDHAYSLDGYAHLLEQGKEMGLEEDQVKSLAVAAVASADAVPEGFKAMRTSLKRYVAWAEGSRDLAKPPPATAAPNPS